MNKIIVWILVIIVVTMGITMAVIITEPKKEKIAETKVVEENNIVQNDIVANVQKEEPIKEANTNFEKISPNAFITYKTAYKKCGHISTEFKEIPKELVNLTKEELKAKYSEWDIEEFSDVNIVISKSVDENCNEHFIVKDKEGIVTIFRKLEDGNEIEYETTEIATEYLTDTDKINMEKGIEVNGIQNLNQLIEDFE